MAPAPQEDTSLLSKEKELSHLEYKSHPSDFEDIGDITLASSVSRGSDRRYRNILHNIAIVAASAILTVSLRSILIHIRIKSGQLVPTGPYRLIEAQTGSSFFDFYDFYDGPDSLGSAGYNVYVSKESAMQSKIAGVKQEDGEEFVYMSSASTKKGPRDSVRLEGKRRFDRGLFVLDVVHMPNGAGVWPAFWLTDEAAWPRNGEIDILEGMFDIISNSVQSTSSVLIARCKCRSQWNDNRQDRTAHFGSMRHVCSCSSLRYDWRMGMDQ